MDHDHCDLRNGPRGDILGRVRDQGDREICWAMAMLSVMEYSLAKNNVVDYELSLDTLMYSLYLHLKSRYLLQHLEHWNGGYTVSLYELFRWVMIYGVAKKSCESSSLLLAPGMTVAYLNDYTAIHKENEESMLRMLRDGHCLVATIRAYRDFINFRYDSHDLNSVYVVEDGDKNKLIQHVVTIIGFGTTPTSKKNFWLILNSWGETFGDKGVGRIYRGSNAIHPSTSQRYLNPLLEVFVCGAVEVKVFP